MSFAITAKNQMEKDQQRATATAKNESVEGAESIPRALVLVGDVLLVWRNGADAM